MDANTALPVVRRRALVIRVSLLVALLVAVMLLGSGATLFLTESARQDAAVINQAGALRMKAWRLAATAAEYRPEATALPTREGQVGERLTSDIEEFEQALHAPGLLDRMASGSPTERRHRMLVSEWRDTVRPALRDAAGGAPFNRSRMEEFVASIDGWVHQLEEKASGRMTLLHTVLGTAITLTGLLALLIVRELRGGLIRPLERSNRALQLLYNTTHTAAPERFQKATVREMLEEARRTTGVKSVTLHLDPATVEEPGDPVGECVAWTTAPDGQPEFCTAPDYTSCPCQQEALPSSGARLLHFALADERSRYGALVVEPTGRSPPEEWVVHLFGDLARQLAHSYEALMHARERERLALVQERTVIARELHDSLAQSLSYLNIQARRLERMLHRGAPASEHGESTTGSAAAPIVTEIRNGLRTAHQQLRDLLTTFRLRLYEPGLEPALRVTASEYARKGDLPVELDLDGLPSLSPNEEIHVLQIVREALANIIRHAGANRAWVRVHPQDSELQVVVEDNGVGLAPREDEADRAHHGITIMKERAGHLGGHLWLTPSRAGGTAVILSFRPGASVPAGGTP